jgi:heme oxygenase (biliverdin-IX-beta and delta-forming)
MPVQLDEPKPMAMLKSSTHDLHRRLDRASCMTRLMATDLSVQEYVEILKKLHALYTAIEQALLVAEQRWGRSVAWQAKAGWLKNDLHALGEFSIDTSTSTHAEQVFLLRLISSNAGLAGCLYVLEGSTLGGQMIAKRLRSTMGHQVTNALSFFDGYGVDTPSIWGANCARMTAVLNDNEKIFVACTSAQHVFEMFIAAMCENDEFPYQKTHANLAA